MIRESLDIHWTRKTEVLSVHRTSLCDALTGLQFYESNEYQETHESIFKYLKRNKEEVDEIEFTEARPT